jgi:hypothetical protein
MSEKNNFNPEKDEINFGKIKDEDDFKDYPMDGK